MKHFVSHMHKHLLKHQDKYIGLAVCCKIILLGILSVPILQAIQHAHAQTVRSITATAGTSGSISPTGVVGVNEGADQTFTITAETGYGISDVLVDSGSIGRVSTYTFTGVTGDYSIDTSFVRLPTFVSALVTYCVPAGKGEVRTLNVLYDTNIDTISPSGNFTIGGDYYTVTVDGSKTLKVQINAIALDPDGDYTLDIATNTEWNNSVLDTAAHTIPYIVDCQPNEITITAGANGTTDVGTGTVTVTQGENQTVTFLPAAGYQVDDVLVDSVSVGAVTSYTFSNIAIPHTLDVTFKVTPPTGGGGGGGTPPLNIDSCPNGDYSSSYYDNDCGQAANTQCENIDYLTNHLPECLDLPAKVTALKKLNDMFTSQQGVVKPIPQKVTTSSLLKLYLQRMAEKLKVLNDVFQSKTSTTTTTNNSDVIKLLTDMAKNLARLNNTFSAP